jgi:hypothetical protein
MTDNITLPREGEQMNEDFIERVWEEAKLLFLEGGEELIPTLIALAYSYGMDDEREACALIAESYEPTCESCPSGVANAIRARGSE